MFRFRSVTLLAAALTLMLVALSGPVAAGSPFVENYQDKGRAGLAGNGDCTFGPGGDESCYFVDVFAQIGWIKENGVRQKGDTICVYRGNYEYDGATGDFTDTILSGCGSADVTVARDLSSASAKGSIATERCVYTETSESCGAGPAISVDLDWTAVEPAYSNRGSWTETFGECTLKDQFRGTFRPAQVTGHVGDIDGEELFGDVARGQAKFSVRCH